MLGGSGAAITLGLVIRWDGVGKGGSVTANFPIRLVAAFRMRGQPQGGSADDQVALFRMLR